MKKILIIFIAASMIMTFASCAKESSADNSSSNEITDETQNEKSSTVEITEDEKTLMYDDYMSKNKEDITKIIEKAKGYMVDIKEVLNNPVSAIKLFGDITAELEKIIEKADEALLYDETKVPEKYKEIHVKYTKSITHIKDLAKTAPEIAMTFDKDKITTLAKDFQSAYNDYSSIVKEYENLK